MRMLRDTDVGPVVVMIQTCPVRFTGHVSVLRSWRQRWGRMAHHDKHLEACIACDLDTGLGESCQYMLVAGWFVIAVNVI